MSRLFWVQSVWHWWNSWKILLKNHLTTKKQNNLNPSQNTSTMRPSIVHLSHVSGVDVFWKKSNFSFSSHFFIWVKLLCSFFKGQTEKHLCQIILSYKNLLWVWGWDRKKSVMKNAVWHQEAYRVIARDRFFYPILSALDKLLGQLGIYATWLTSIAYLQKQLRIFHIFFTPRFFLWLHFFLLHEAIRNGLAY